MQEEEAVRRCETGDMTALAALFEMYHLKVYGTALGIVRDRMSAEDVTQQVFLELPKSLRRFDNRRPLAPWVHGITVRISLAAAREQRRGKAVSLTAIEDLRSLDPAPDDVAEDRERHNTIWQAIGTLQPKQRAAVVLRYYGGLGEAEMATALGCRRGTVKSRLHHALRVLARALSTESSPRGAMKSESAFKLAEADRPPKTSPAAFRERG